MHPLLRLGGILDFWGGQNIFNFRGVSYEGVRGLYFLGGGQFILCPFSHFEMQDFKTPKIFCLQYSYFPYSYFRPNKTMKMLSFLFIW